MPSDRVFYTSYNQYHFSTKFIINHCRALYKTYRSYKVSIFLLVYLFTAFLTYIQEKKRKRAQRPLTDLPRAINQTITAAAFTTASATTSATSRLPIPPVLIQPQPSIFIQPRPTIVRPITEQLDLSPIDVAYNFYTALYWINKRVSILYPSDLQFKACYKHGDINLPLFQPPLEYLRDFLESYSTSARQFREQLRLYNTVLAFTSVNCTVTNHSIAYSGLNCFQIHGKLYYLQGPLEPPTNITPRYAQLYFYNPSYTIDVRLQACSNTQLDITVLQ